MMAFTTDRIVDIFLKTIYFVCYALILFFSVALFVEIVPNLLDGITENELVIHGIFLAYFMSAILLFPHNSTMFLPKSTTYTFLSLPLLPT